jgi:hypothetical protein
MAKVGDRSNIFFEKCVECVVGKRPIEFVWAEKRPMKRRAVTQESDPHLLDQVKVLLPSFVMAALFHLIDAAAVYTRRAVLDARRKHKGRRHNRFVVGLKI